MNFAAISRYLLPVSLAMSVLGGSGVQRASGTPTPPDNAPEKQIRRDAAQGKAPIHISEQTGRSNPTTAAKAPAAPAAPTAVVGADPDGNKRISNSYSGDIKEVMQSIATDFGVTIQTDESVKEANVSFDLVNDTIESALNKVVGGYLWIKKQEGGYLVSAATPRDSFFGEFAETHPYRPQNQAAETIATLLSPVYQPYVTVDRVSNIVIVTAPAQRMPKILKMLAAVDGKPRQFTVEALITELNGGTSEDFGFSWNWHNFGVDDGLNINYARATSTDIATLKALLGQQKASLRANPRVSAFEGKETTLNVGSETYLTIQTGVLNLQSSQIQVIKTGVSLKITGIIGDDGYLTLKLETEVGDFTTPVGGYPTVTVRRASTNVRVKSGETLVIGGLIQDTDSSVRTKTPGLGDLPLVGQFFQQKTKSRKRTDIVMMITPRITEDGVGQEGITTKMPLDPNAPLGPPLPHQPIPAIQIRCGAEDFSSRTSGVWKSDRYFSGGHLNGVAAKAIAGAADPVLYASYRSGANHFGYSIPVPNGKYRLKLGFVELSCTEAGQRTFNVTVNDSPGLSALDIFAEAGGQGKPLIKSLPVQVTNGTLELKFEGIMDNPTLSTIQIVPAP